MRNRWLSVKEEQSPSINSFSFIYKLGGKYLPIYICVIYIVWHLDCDLGKSLQRGAGEMTDYRS